MYLYLDDVRTPKQNMHVVRNYKECIDVLQNNYIDYLSLDHDLGEEKTGYDVAKWIVQEGIEIPHINIHSANPVGKDNIRQLLKRYCPNTKVTIHWLPTTWDN